MIKKSWVIYTLLIFLFLWESSYAKQQKAPDNCLSGIGIVVERTGKGYTVKGVFKGSPADGKLQKGDIIKEIDGESTYSMTLRKVLNKINQPEGKQVKVKYSRGSSYKEIILNSRNIPITIDSIPKLGVPKLRNIGIRDEIITVEFKKKGKFKPGHTFFLFDNSNFAGIARALEIYGTKGYLKLIKKRNKKIDTSKLKIYYYCYIPKVDSYGPKSVSKKVVSSKKTIPKTGEPKILIRHIIYQAESTNYIRTTARVSNVGNAEAKDLKIMCCYVDKFDRMYSRDVRGIGTLMPGESQKIIFFSMIPGNILKLRTGLSKALNVINVKISNGSIVMHKTLKSKFIIHYNGKTEIYKP